MSSMSPQPAPWPALASQAFRESLEEQARRKGVRPIASVRDLVNEDIWESGEELDAFLDHVRVSRQSELA